MWLELQPCKLSPSLKMPTGHFFNARFGSSPGWGAKQVNHLHGFRVGGFFFAPVLGQDYRNFVQLKVGQDINVHGECFVK